MAQDFGHSKRRIQEAKKKKREEKRLKKLNKDIAQPTTDPNISAPSGTEESAMG